MGWYLQVIHKETEFISTESVEDKKNEKIKKLLIDNILNLKNSIVYESKSDYEYQINGRVQTVDEIIETSYNSPNSWISENIKTFEKIFDELINKIKQK